MEFSASNAVSLLAKRGRGILDLVAIVKEIQMGPIEKQLREIAKVHALYNNTKLQDWFEWRAAKYIAHLESQNDDLDNEVNGMQATTQRLADEAVKLESMLSPVTRVQREECPECKGLKYDPKHTALESPEPCSECNGSGEVPVKCEKCKGNGRVPNLGSVTTAGGELIPCPYCLDGSTTQSLKEPGHGHATEQVFVGIGSTIYHITDDILMESRFKGECIGIKKTACGFDLWLKFENNTTTYWIDSKRCFPDSLTARLLGKGSSNA